MFIYSRVAPPDEKETQIRPPCIDFPSGKYYCAIHRARISTIEELIGITEEELLDMNTVGPSMAEIFIRVVQDYLKQNHIDRPFPRDPSVPDPLRISMNVPRIKSLDPIGSNVVCLNLSEPLYQGLVYSGIETVKQLLTLTEEEIRATSWAGNDRYLELVSKTRIFLEENKIKRKFPATPRKRRQSATKATSSVEPH